MRKRREPAADDDVVTAFRDGQVTARANRRMEGFTQAVQEIGYQGIRRGDLVIHSMDGFAGAIGISDSDGKASPVVHAYSPARDVDVRFFAYMLRTLARLGFITSLARGIRERSTAFDAATFTSLALPVPPLSTQRAIADYLDHETARIDALVDAKQRVADLLWQEYETIVTALVTTGELAPAGFDDGRGAEWLGEMPDGWSVMPLKRVVACDNSGEWGGEPGMEEVDLPVATTAQIARDGTFLIDQMPVRSFTPTQASYYTCRRGDIVVVKSSGSATSIISGKAGLITPDTPAFVFSNFLMRLRVDHEVAVPGFVYAFLTSHITRERIKRMVSATTYPNLKVEEYMASMMPVPPITEQQRIVRMLTAYSSRLARATQALSASRQLLQDYRQALITSAITGEKVLPEAA